MELLQNFYETTLDALKDAKNDRLWFKTNSKLGKLYFELNDFTKLQRILKQLRQSCQVSLSLLCCIAQSFVVDIKSLNLFNYVVVIGFYSEGGMSQQPVHRLRVTRISSIIPGEG